MFRALAAILITASFGLPASAQSYVESNARDAICEWQFKGKRGIEKCHIIAMGTHAMGDLVFMFTVNSMTVSLVENEEAHYHRAQIGSGGFWDFKARWKGLYTDKFRMLGDPETSNVAVNTIKLSNGYTIKIVY